MILYQKYDFFFPCNIMMKKIIRRFVVIKVKFSPHSSIIIKPKSVIKNVRGLQNLQIPYL